MKLSKFSRVLHRWGSIIALLPITIIIVSGIVLQLKKVSPYIQPPTLRGAGTEPAIGFERILEVARSVPEAEIEFWEDVDRLDVRPGKGVVGCGARTAMRSRSTPKRPRSCRLPSAAPI
jgi:hypothetical protein